MLNPVFRRELNTLLRSWKTYGALTVYVAILMAVERIAGLQVNNYAYGRNYGFDPRIVAERYTLLSGFQFVLIAIITPALTAGAIAGERERQTLNLMLITKMSTFKIAAGKLMSSLSIVVLLIVASMPVFAMMFYYGGVSLPDLIAVILYTILSSAAMGSICIFLSSLFKRTVSATVLSYITIMVLCIGTFVAAFLMYIVFNIFRMYNPLTGYNPYLSSSFSTAYSTSAAAVAVGNIGEKVINAIFIAIFSLNPFVGFLSIIDTQMGTGVVDNLFYEINYMYRYSSYGGNTGSINLWAYNVAANIIITTLMLFFTSKVLTPVKASRKNK